MARQSAFVSVVFRAHSPQAAAECLGAVLEDVNRNQAEISQPQIELAQTRIRKDEKKLRIAEDFIESFGARLGSKRSAFNFSDSKFSASSLLGVTLQAKQGEITELKNSIQGAKLALAEPQTKRASFTTPVYAPDVRVGPSRLLVALIGLVGGALLAVAGLLLLRAIRVLRSKSAAKVS